jgi:type IV pilus assembly protein PilV
LVEVLVSMLIMGLGMVGLAALQARTVSYQLGAGQRAQLAGLLSDYAERVRSNLSQAPGQVSGSAYLHDKTWQVQSGGQPTAAKVDCLAKNASCSASDLADFDKSQWLAAVRRELPLGSALIQGEAAGGITVTFMWVDKDRTTDKVTGRVLVQSPECTASMSGLELQGCCPKAAGQVPAGVRCARFSLLP